STCTYSVTQPTVVTATCSGTNASCNGGTGSASVAASGGTSPYTYLWSTNATTTAISSLVAGTYSITVTDNNGCKNNCSYSVTQPTALSTSCSGTPVSCNGGNNGSALVAASGGTTPYGYLWSNSATASSISSLVAGTYSVTVTDGNNCKASCSYTVTQPAAL